MLLLAVGAMFSCKVLGNGHLLMTPCCSQLVVSKKLGDSNIDPEVLQSRSPKGTANFENHPSLFVSGRGRPRVDSQGRA